MLFYIHLNKNSIEQKFRTMLSLQMVLILSLVRFMEHQSKSSFSSCELDFSPDGGGDLLATDYERGKCDIGSLIGFAPKMLNLLKPSK